MKRIDPHFKTQSVIDLENQEFLDEMFEELFDCGDVDSETDKVPDLPQLAKLTNV